MQVSSAASFAARSNDLILSFAIIYIFPLISDRLLVPSFVTMSYMALLSPSITVGPCAGRLIPSCTMRRNCPLFTAREPSAVSACAVLSHTTFRRRDDQWMAPLHRKTACPPCGLALVPHEAISSSMPSLINGQNMEASASATVLIFGMPYCAGKVITVNRHVHLELAGPCFAEQHAVIGGEHGALVTRQRIGGTLTMTTRRRWRTV